MFTVSTVLRLLSLVSLAVANKNNDCDTVLRSVRMEVSPVMIHSLCRGSTNVTLVISCEQSVWVEYVQGFCHSFDLNIGQVSTRHVLKSDTVTLNLMKLDDLLDAARVVILTPEDVTQYRISVWGYHNTRFLLTVENMCSESRPINGQDALWNYNATIFKDLPLNRTSSNKSSYNGHQLPEYSLPNNLPLQTQLDSNTNKIIKTKSTPLRIRGGIKLKSFRPSYPTQESLQAARRNTVLPRLYTPMTRLQTPIYTSTGIDNKLSKLGSILTRRDSDTKEAVSAETNIVEKVSDKHPEVDKLEWMESKRLVFEKKMDYYQSLYQSSENISDYSDYVTETTDNGLNPSTSAKSTNQPKVKPRESEAKMDVQRSQDSTAERLLRNATHVSENKMENYSPVKLLYRVLNYEENNVSHSAIESKEVQAVDEVVTSSYLPLESLMESLVTMKNTVGETSSTRVDVPLFLFNNFIDNETSQNIDHSSVLTVATKSMDITSELSPSTTVQGGEISTEINVAASSTPGEYHDYKNTVSTQSTTGTSTQSTTGTSMQISSSVKTVVTNTDSAHATSLTSIWPTPTSTVTSSTPTSTLANTGYTSTPTITMFLQTDSYQSTKQSQTAFSSSVHLSTTLVDKTPPLSTSITTSFQPTISPATFQNLSKTLLPESASPGTISASNTTASTTPSTDSTATRVVTTPSTLSSTNTTSSIGTTSPKENNIFKFTLPTFNDPASDSVLKSTTSGQTEGTSKDDETVWPVVIALVLGIPALVVVGIAVTVIHRRSRPNPQKVFGMKTLRACSTPRLSANSSTIRTTLRLSATSVDV